jgi:carbon-monoxide dehydrogenase medium subunit
MKAFQYLSPIYDFEYLRPRSLDEALAMMDGTGVKPMAGGTDLSVALKEGYRPRSLMDLSGLRNELSYIESDEDYVRIGALTTFGEIYRSRVIEAYATCLREAAYNIGTWQIRNLATIGGNLANASPAADSGPPLMVLDASVVMRSARAQGVKTVRDVFLGPKKSALRENELITEIRFKRVKGLKSGWARRGRRSANTISVVNVAVAALVVDGRFRLARIALGSVGPTPILATEASEVLVGRRATDREAIARAADRARDASSPITDVRGTREYRLKMVKHLTEKLLMRVGEAS